MLFDGDVLGYREGELLDEIDGEVDGELLGEVEGDLDGELLGEVEGKQSTPRILISISRSLLLRITRAFSELKFQQSG